jgi:hypothetical protein
VIVDGKTIREACARFFVRPVGTEAISSPMSRQVCDGASVLPSLMPASYEEKSSRLRVYQVTAMAQVMLSITEDFSITRGGPLHWLPVRLGHAGDERRRVVRRTLVVVLITWLLLLSLVQGLAWGPHIKIRFLSGPCCESTFLDYSSDLILAESRIDRRWRTLVRSELVDEKTLPYFEAVLPNWSAATLKMLG